MHAARGSKLGILKGLHAQADAIDARRLPGSGVITANGFRIGLERHFAQRTGKCACTAPMIRDEICGVEQARRPAAQVDRVHRRRLQPRAPHAPDPLRNTKPHARRFHAQRPRIRGVEAARRHPRMKITIGAFRLAKRHLNINAQFEPRGI